MARNEPGDRSAVCAVVELLYSRLYRTGTNIVYLYRSDRGSVARNEPGDRSDYFRIILMKTK